LGEGLIQEGLEDPHLQGAQGAGAALSPGQQLQGLGHLIEPEEYLVFQIENH
jgi:hypothetical protein